MGYFNIFYKITRIIDMLTRKRNRKAIMVILIIIAVVFLFKTKVQANESLDYSVNYYMKMSRDFDSTGDIKFVHGNDSSGDYNKYCYVFPVYSGYTYNIKWTTNAYANFGFQSDLSGINLSADTSYNVGTILAYTNSKDFTYTCHQDGFLFIGSSALKDYYYPSGLTDGDLNLTITTDYDGTSNFTALHNDLSRIEQLLKDYLYGDVNKYNVSLKSVDGLYFNASGFYSAPTGIKVYYFKVKKNYSYNISWSSNAVDTSAYYPRIGYGNIIPSVGSYSINNYQNIGLNNPTSTSYSFTATDDYYFYINTNKNIGLFEITSNYNEGQEMGLYGGLTNIDNQVLQQGQEISDDITSTDYNQSDVAINSDSVNNVDSSETDGLFTTIFNNFNNAATGGVDSITIPLPHNSGKLVLLSNLVSSHLGALSTLVSAFWYFVFGFYAFKFVNNLLHNIKDGSILDGFKNNNEVITQDML